MVTFNEQFECTKVFFKSLEDYGVIVDVDNNDDNVSATNGNYTLNIKKHSCTFSNNVTEEYFEYVFDTIIIDIDLFYTGDLNIRFMSEERYSGGIYLPSFIKTDKFTKRINQIIEEGPLI